MNRYFIRFLASASILTLMFGLARTSVAQDSNKVAIRAITANGSAAFMFSIQGLGNFGIGAGSDANQLVLTGAGAKWFIADDIALRLLVNFNTRSGNSGNPDSSSAKPVTTTFGIGAGVEMHTRPLYSISPYWGAMISFADSSFDNGETGKNPAAPVGDIMKATASMFGVAALAGFDWFFTRGIAIGAEGALGFASSSASTTDLIGTHNSQTVTTIKLVTNGDVHLVVNF